MSTCNRLDLQTLGSQPVMPQNLPDHWSAPTQSSLYSRFPKLITMLISYPHSSCESRNDLRPCPGVGLNAKKENENQTDSCKMPPDWIQAPKYRVPGSPPRPWTPRNGIIRKLDFPASPAIARFFAKSQIQIHGPRFESSSKAKAPFGSHLFATKGGARESPYSLHGDTLPYGTLPLPLPFRRGPERSLVG